MPRRKVTRLRKFCGLLAGHSWQHAERIAEATTDLVRPWLPEDQQVVDMLHFLLCLAEKLDAYRERLTAIDNQHLHELRVDRTLREQRDGAAADLRQHALQLRDSLDGLFGPGGTIKILEDSAVIPTDPVALHQYMGHVRNNLDDQDFPMPKPLQKGFKLDRNEAIADFDEPFQRLAAALKALETAESASKHSQSEKDEEVDETAVFTGKVIRFYEALFDLAGYDRLSDRLRRSSHRVAAGQPDGTEPEEPQAGDGGGAEPGSEPMPAAEAA